MKALLCGITLLLFTNLCFGQHVYQIRADSVRIYNTCDTAELILENRTQDTLGFLYNKGKGRTEFRRLRLQSIGNSAIAITGQDTLQLGTIIKTAVDTIYRSNDTLYYRKTDGGVVGVKLDLSNWGDGRYDLLSSNFRTIPDGDSLLWGQWPVNKVVGYFGYQTTDMPKLSDQAFQSVGSNRYYNGLVVRSPSTGFDMAVNWDGELLGPNGAFIRIKDDTKTAWSNWRELLFKDYGDKTYVSRVASVVDPISAAVYNGNLDSIRNTTIVHIGGNGASNRPEEQPGFLFAGGNNPINSIGKFQAYGSYGTEDAWYYRRAYNVSGATVWGSWFRVASRQWASSTFAPAASSGSYIQNQSASAQVANTWINGTNVMAKAAIYANPDVTKDIGLFTGVNVAGTNLRWAIYRSGAEGAGNAGNNLLIGNFDNTGVPLGTPISINRATGVTAFAVIPSAGGNPVFTQANHPIGSSFNPGVLTGPNVIASLVTNPSGHVTSVTTRAITAADVSAAPASGAANYIQNTTNQQASANFNIAGAGTTGSTLTSGEGFRGPSVGSNNSAAQLTLIGGATSVNSNRGGQINLFAGVSPVTPGVITFHTGTGAGGTQQPERMKINAAGAVSINNIPALATAGTNFLTANAGVISNRTAVQVLSDIGAAPVTGGGGYIQNQQAAAQTANVWMNGVMRNNYQFVVSKEGANTVTGSYLLYNAAQTRGANLQLSGDATPGLAIWVHSGTAWTERMRVLSTTGNVGIGNTAPAEKLEVTGNIKTSGNIIMPTGAGAGKVMTSDGTGKGTWQTATAPATPNLNAVLTAGSSSSVGITVGGVNTTSVSSGNILSLGSGSTTRLTLDLAGDALFTGSIKASGGMTLAAKLVATPYTATLNDHTIIANNDDHNLTVTLPDATLCHGKIYVLKYVGGFGSMTIQPVASQKIDGAVNLTFSTSKTSYIIQAVSGAWYILSKN